MHNNAEEAETEGSDTTQREREARRQKPSQQAARQKQPCTICGPGLAVAGWTLMPSSVRACRRWARRATESLDMVAGGCGVQATLCVQEGWGEW